MLNYSTPDIIRKAPPLYILLGDYARLRQAATLLNRCNVSPMVILWNRPNKIIGILVS